MKRRLRRLWLLVLILLTLSLGVGGGVLLDRQVLAAHLPPNTIPSDAIPEFRLMGEAWNTIWQVYVDRTAVQATRLTYGAISGMVSALGDTGHSTFLTPEMAQQQHNLTQGQFEGIGAEVQVKDGHVVVVAPMDGSPAQHAGLRPGDVILKVDGEDITDLPLDQVVRRILGPAGSQVTLTILRPGEEQARDFILTRAHITLHNVSWARIPGTTVAHLRIAAFSHGVTPDLQKALTEIQQQGLTGIVLDLRDNPGGLLDMAVDVTSQFLTQGNVLLEKDAQGQVKPVPVSPDGVAGDVPLVVLINGGTASAAEIVAGALQDAGRATLIGQTSFGTGTVLNEFPLSDGSALLLATEEWLTPNGRVIWHQGIPPDVAVALSTDATPLFPKAEAGMTAAQFNASGDEQLLQAVDVLNRSPASSSGGKMEEEAAHPQPKSAPVGAQPKDS